MPISRPIIDPRMIDQINTYGDFFNKFCTFYEKTGRGPTGGVSNVLTPVSGLADIECRLGRPGGSEKRRRDGDVATRTQAVLLKGYYQGITAKMVVRVDATDYSVVTVLYDGESTVTEVQVEILS